MYSIFFDKNTCIKMELNQLYSQTFLLRVQIVVIKLNARFLFPKKVYYSCEVQTICPPKSVLSLFIIIQ